MVIVMAVGMMIAMVIIVVMLIAGGWRALEREPASGDVFDFVFHTMKEPAYDVRFWLRHVVRVVLNDMMTCAVPMLVLVTQRRN